MGLQALSKINFASFIEGTQSKYFHCNNYFVMRYEIDLRLHMLNIGYKFN